MDLTFFPLTLDAIDWRARRLQVPRRKAGTPLVLPLTDAAGTVQRVPIEGGESTVLATNQSLPSELAIDGSNIYWINSVVDGAVMKLAK